jgi:hypothetical protein
MKKILIVILVLSAVSFGLDGRKTGFVFGIGGGPSFTTYNQDESGFPESPQFNTLGFATDFVIGYGFNENFLLTYFSNVNWFSLHNVNDENVIISNGNSGIGAFYFFNESRPRSFTPSPYVFGGLGWSSWSTPFEQGQNSTSWLGLGATVGVGYEFIQHLGVQLNVFTTDPSAQSGGVNVQSNSIGFQLDLVGLAY